MNSRMFLYFTLAFLPALFQADSPPEGWWGVSKWIGLALYQGLLAIKAFQSPAPVPPPPGNPLADALSRDLNNGGTP